MRSYRLYNLIMFFCCIFFAFGSVWIWRGEWAEVAREKKMSEAVVVEKVSEINKDKEIEEIVMNTNTNTEKNDLEIGDNVTTTIATPTIKIVKTLPKKINLDVPFTSQAPEKIWVDPWEDFCEEAAVLMLDAYYEEYNLSPLFAKDELLRIWEWEQTRNFGKSIEIKEIKEIFSKYFNLKSKIVENPTIGQIKTFIAEGKPVLALTYGKDLPNPYFRNGGPEYHALIIRGYTSEKFITNDPGSGWSKNFAYKYDVLMNAIHDWNNGNVSEGKKVILVIE